MLIPRKVTWMRWALSSALSPLPLTGPRPSVPVAAALQCGAEYAGTSHRKYEGLTCSSRTTCAGASELQASGSRWWLDGRLRQRGAGPKAEDYCVSRGLLCLKQRIIVFEAEDYCV
jgi:hypothetical protein